MATAILIPTPVTGHNRRIRFVNKIREFFDRFREWRHSRKVRKAQRIAGKTADTAAAGMGFVMRLGVKIVATVLLIAITTGVLFTCIFAIYVKTCLTTDLDVSLEEASLALSSTIWYQDGDNWYELATLHKDTNRIWVEQEDIPLYIQQAAVAIEDRRFYTHKGVDWYRTTAAFFNMFLGMKDQFGGSTITQQLIKNITQDDEVTVQRKLMEIFRALEFEKIYTKDEIMTWYLNYIYLGQGCSGVGTAAQAYFAKDVSDLSLAECAAIIGITNNPSAYDPYQYPENNQDRRETILRAMYDQEYITYEEYQAAMEESATMVFTNGLKDEDDEEVYSYYVDTIIRDVINDLAEAKGCSTLMAENLLYNGGYDVYACIDMRIQNIVDSIYENPSSLPSPYRSSGQQLQSGIVIIDPYTGEIAALSGGVGNKEEAGSLSLNRATQSTRPPGSSLKPLSVYAPALDLGLVSQTDYINDSPNGTLSGTSWYPKNSGNWYSGTITIHDALMYSKNTVAAKLLDKLGLQTSFDYLTEHFGLTTLVEDTIDETTGQTVTDKAYSPLSLGQLSYGATVREMAEAYTAFVNNGVMTKGRTYSLITDPDGNIVLENLPKQTVAIKANTAWNMCDMLQDAVSNGTGGDAYFSTTAVAGKTGTTSDDKDRYFVGFTMYYVCAVWTGYDTPAQMYFNSNPAAQIFRSVMSQVHSGYSWWSFPTPTISSSTNIFSAAPTPTPSPSPTPEPSESPEPSTSPTPPPEGEDPNATSTPVPTITAVPTSAPTPTPTTEPTQAPTPTPTAEPTPVPTTEATPVPPADPTPTPTQPPAPDPTPVDEGIPAQQDSIPVTASIEE